MKVTVFCKDTHSFVRMHIDVVDMIVETVDGDIIINVIDSADTVYPYAIRNFNLCVGEL